MFCAKMFVLLKPTKTLGTGGMFCSCYGDEEKWTLSHHSYLYQNSETNIGSFSVLKWLTVVMPLLEAGERLIKFKYNVLVFGFRSSKHEGLCFVASTGLWSCYQSI